MERVKEGRGEKGGMMIGKRRFLVAAAAAWALGSAPAWAGNKYTISLRQKVTDSVAVYHGRGDRTPLEQVSGHQQVKTWTRGEGLFAAINKEYQRVDDKVVGIDYGGHSRISLVNQGDRVYLHKDMLVDDTVDGVPLLLKADYLAEVKFLSGGWDDYEAGRDVTLELTKEGQKTSLEAASAALKGMLSQIKRAFERQLAEVGAEFGEIKLDSWDATGRGSIRGNKNRLTVESASGDIQVSFVVRGNF